MDEEPVVKKHKKKGTQDQKLAYRITVIGQILNGMQHNPDYHADSF